MIPVCTGSTDAFVFYKIFRRIELLYKASKKRAQQRSSVENMCHVIFCYTSDIVLSSSQTKKIYYSIIGVIVSSVSEVSIKISLSGRSQ